VRCRQRHADVCVSVDGVDPGVPEADALITGTPGVALCVLTADCVPLLLVAPEWGVAAAVHAGWRERCSVSRSGPCAPSASASGCPVGDSWCPGSSIGACCYEVGRDIADDIERCWGAMPEAVTKYGSKGRLDLRLINRACWRGWACPRGRLPASVPAPDVRRIPTSPTVRVSRDAWGAPADR